MPKRKCQVPNCNYPLIFTGAFKMEITFMGIVERKYWLCPSHWKEAEKEFIESKCKMANEFFTKK